jgi:hypothetical protein
MTRPSTRCVPKHAPHGQEAAPTRSFDFSTAIWPGPGAPCQPHPPGQAAVTFQRPERVLPLFPCRVTWCDRQLSFTLRERTQLLPQRSIDRSLYVRLRSHHHWLGGYRRPATALGSPLARPSRRRKMIGAPYDRPSNHRAAEQRDELRAVSCVDGPRRLNSSS